jgi:VanZ family protein
MNIYKYWLPVFLWIGFICFMSTESFSAQRTSVLIEPLVRFFMPSISRHRIKVIHFLIRKAAHVTEYFISGLLLFRAYRNGSTENHPWRWAFASLLTVIAIAATDEFHQSFIVVRTGSLSDVGIDTAGGLLAQALCVVKNTLFRRGA